jgi:hypothetical protein
MNIKKTIVLILILASLLQSYVNYKLDKRIEYYQGLFQYTDYTDNRSIEWFNHPDMKNLTRYGYYQPNQDFYCVWMAGFDYEEIKDTDAHELCHYYVDMDRDHFLNEKKQVNYTMIRAGQKILKGYDLFISRFFTDK